jgi:hypothetical protein
MEDRVRIERASPKPIVSRVHPKIPRVKIKPRKSPSDPAIKIKCNLELINEGVEEGEKH